MARLQITSIHPSPGPSYSMPHKPLDHHLFSPHARFLEISSPHSKSDDSVLVLSRAPQPQPLSFEFLSSAETQKDE